MDVDLLMLLVLDLIGTFAFALNGALTAIRSAHLDIVGVITLGVITAVGGGTLRDVLIRRVPSVLSSGLYAIPALIGSTIVVVASVVPATAAHATLATIVGAAACFLVRLAGLRFEWDAPRPRGVDGGPSSRRDVDGS